MRSQPSVDHGEFDPLKKPFGKPQDVTAACLSCHNQRHKEIMASSHWAWERIEFVEGKGIRKIGKRNAINNNCIGIGGNQQTCNKCHAGYGYGDESFDFKDPNNIDCLACHDNSNLYIKATGGAGMPDPSVDLNKVAQKVGRPQRANCGACHFFGGGGNNVKHGDLEQALFDTTKDVDVHMATNGMDLHCVDCHRTEKHQMEGKMYSVSSMNRNRSSCESCHGNMPHDDETLNRHMLKVACQSCHIPVYAKVNPTKLDWDWSTAGQLKDGKPFDTKGPGGVDTYSSMKGTFKWGTNVVPEYIWFNGKATHYMFGDPVEPGKPVKINALHGSYEDPESKLIPVKVARGKQIYDTTHNYLIQPKTVSNKPGDGGFWKEFNWKRAAEEGMKEIGLPFSGNYGFIETEMTWPLNHMVSPKEQTLSCTECHQRDKSRLKGLTGFYIPGRDYSPFVDGFGKTLVWLSVLGVLGHGMARIFTRTRKKEA